MRKPHRHDYDMIFPYEARPLLAVYRCKQCGDTVLDMATAMQKEGTWSMRSGPGQQNIIKRDGQWWIVDTGIQQEFGPYRWRWVAVILRTIFEE